LRFQPSLRFQLSWLVLLAALPLSTLVVYNTLQQLNIDAHVAVAEAERLAATVALRAESRLDRARALLDRLVRLDAVRRLDPAHCGPLFTQFGEVQAEYTNLVTVRRDGTRICSAIAPGPLAPPQVDRSLYLDATLSRGSFALGRVTRGIFTGRWILFAGLPISSAGAGPAAPVGAPADGVLALSIDLVALKLVDAADRVSPGMAVHLLDAKGMVLASNAAGGSAIGSVVPASAAPLAEHRGFHAATERAAAQRPGRGPLLCHGRGRRQRLAGDGRPAGRHRAASRSRACGAQCRGRAAHLVRRAGAGSRDPAPHGASDRGAGRAGPRRDGTTHPAGGRTAAPPTCRARRARCARWAPTST
jgi:hypothetical protein